MHTRGENKKRTGRQIEGQWMKDVKIMEWEMVEEDCNYSDRLMPCTSSILTSYFPVFDIGTSLPTLW